GNPKSLPVGERRCHPCRRQGSQRKAQIGALRLQPEQHPCPACGVPVTGYHTRRCDPCRLAGQRAIWARKNAKRSARRSAEAAARQALLPPKPVKDLKPAREMRPCDHCGELTKNRFCNKEHADRWWNANRRRP